MTDMQQALDDVLRRVTTGSPRVPGVVAVVTDRERDVYTGAAGERVLGSGEAMTPDTVCAIFSTTKAVTGTVCLQLVEEGRLDLDAPAREYVPELGEVQVLEGFAEDGSPRLRAPRRDAATRMLLLHTAGFAYDFINEHHNRLATDHGGPASSPPAARPCGRRSCSTRASSGSTAPTSTGPGWSWRGSPAAGSARS